MLHAQENEPDNLKVFTFHFQTFEGNISELSHPRTSEVSGRFDQVCLAKGPMAAPLWLAWLAGLAGLAGWPVWLAWRLRVAGC